MNSKSIIITIGLEPKYARKLEQMAKIRGIKPEELAKEWILEHLQN